MKPNTGKPNTGKPNSDSTWVWRVVDVLSSAVIVLTIGVAFMALAQAQAVFI